MIPVISHIDVGLRIFGVRISQTLPSVFMSSSIKLLTDTSCSMPTTKFIGPGSTTRALVVAPLLAYRLSDTKISRMNPGPSNFSLAVIPVLAISSRRSADRALLTTMS